MKRLLLITITLSLFAAAQASERITPVVKAVQKVQSAVVNVRTETVIKRSGPYNDPYYDELWGRRGTYKGMSLGTGVIIRSDGIVVTNYHVIDAATKIQVISPDETVYDAEIVGGDKVLDIAILKITGDNGVFPLLTLGSSFDLMPGETVIAIGNPYGLSSSVTTGVISNTRRILRADDEYAVFIQTDALINPGNSGGPLINLDGEVIGINSAIYKDAQGIGFAIPIDSIKRVLPEILETKAIRKGYMGFMLQAPQDPDEPGLYVSDIESTSDAYRAGIRNSDYISRLDGIALAGRQSVDYILRTFPPGQSILVDYERGGENYKATIKLTEYPVDFGIKVMKYFYGIDIAESNGAVIVTGSSHPKYIKNGDSIVAIDGADVADMRQLNDALSKASYANIVISIMRNKTRYDVSITP